LNEERENEHIIRSRSPDNPDPTRNIPTSEDLRHSKDDAPSITTRGNRKSYPSSWGYPSSQMKMKKRVLCVFDGTRRILKDPMLDTAYQSHMNLDNEKAYVTDLDVQTLRRVELFHNATEEEKGSWVADDLTGIDLEKLMEIKRVA
jgi:hypothetical protein